MTRQHWLILAAVAAALFLAGGIAALTTIHRDGYSCGSVLHTTTYSPGTSSAYSALLADRVQGDCQAAISDRRAIAYPLLGVGAVGMLVGYVKYHERAAA